jgi:DNA repair protein RecO (recombination protein O)
LTDERATGLILRTRPLTETSLIAHWLTPDLGRLATVAKGARRPKSPFRGKLDLFYAADFSFARSRRSDLHLLREISLRDTHSALREDLGWLRQATYCARLIEMTTETETPLPVVFELLRGLLNWLPGQPPRPHAIFAFEVRLLADLGQAPDPTRAAVSPGARGILGRLREADWSLMDRLKPSPVQLGEIQRFLHGFLIYHLGRIPPGRAAALAVD